MSLEGSSRAACAVHTTIPAVAICSRCGNYICDGCRGLGREDVCDACEVVVGSFPLTRAGFDVSQALSYSWTRYKAEWVLPTLLSLAFFVASGITSFVADLASTELASPDSVAPALIAASLVQLVGSLFQGVVLSGTMRVAVVALQGQIPTMEHVAQGMRHSGTVLALQVFYFAVGNAVGLPLGMAFESGAVSATDTGLVCALGVGGLLLLPVSVYVALGIQNIGVETMIDPDASMMDALSRSWTVADGARGDLFIAGLVGSLVVIGGLVACCVGLIPAVGVTMYLTTATYLALRAGVVPPPARKFD